MQLQARSGCVLRVGTSRAVRRARLPPLSASARPEAAALADDSLPGPSRRNMLALAAAALVAAASTSHPAYALEACSALTEAEEIACLRAELSEDTVSASQTQANYRSFSDKKAATLATGVPVAVLDSEYARSTLQLRDNIIAYANMDVNDYKARVPLIKTIRSEGSDWVSKYARGGSARTDSARRMYTAVGAVIGHLAANGYAPMPKPKLKVVLSNVDQAKAFLEEGK